MEDTIKKLYISQNLFPFKRVQKRLDKIQRFKHFNSICCFLYAFLMLLISSAILTSMFTTMTGIYLGWNSFIVVFATGIPLCIISFCLSLFCGYAHHSERLKLDESDSILYFQLCSSMKRSNKTLPETTDFIFVKIDNDLFKVTCLFHGSILISIQDTIYIKS